MKKDLMASVLLLSVAAVYYAATVRIPISMLADEVGPHGLPTILAALLGLVGLSLGARALLTDRHLPSPTAADREQQGASPLRALGLLATGALYVPVAWLLGYIPALVLVLAGVAFYEGMKPSWRMVAVVGGGAAFFWLLFSVILGGPQPTGMLF
jgi:hypothetical protein